MIIVEPPSGGGAAPSPAPPATVVSVARVDGLLRSCLLRVETTTEGHELLVAKGGTLSPRARDEFFVKLGFTGRGLHTLETTFGGIPVTIRAICRTKAGAVVGAVKAARALLRVEHTLTPPGSWRPDQPVLTPSGQQFLRVIQGKLRGVSVLRMRCDGYTATWPPSPVSAYTLSLQRARLVCQMLRRTAPRIPPRLIPHGRSNPIATNDTETGRAVNRRVGITVTHRGPPRRL